ncbi:MAG TPA: folylpolyglutamate synthase/dihydrofolate synthase family protein [Terriglobales bacterium]|nr:folylpolyglutamate synthase/dihydrofolate synthase family protein [Terriglobales bacterium]
MTYAEAVARLLGLRRGEITGMAPGLERIEALLAALGHPESRYTLVQIGGTNGKGSAAAMLAGMLKAAGRRVGLYTSPHLVSFRERIRVNGAPIGEDAVADGVDALGTLIAREDATMFEAATALALDHFAHERVDIAVLEVGLGGRGDATTVGRPAVTVLTRIDLDHQAWLGPTIESIADAKAAIIRSGTAVVSAQRPEARAIIEARAAETGVPLLLEGRDLWVDARDAGVDGARIDCAGPGFRFTDLALPLPGVHQPGNALAAVTAAHVLGVGERAIREGLARTRWPGRLQIVRRDPWLVLDGAHNPDGARALAASLRGMFGGVGVRQVRGPEVQRASPPTITFVLGVYADKDARGIVEALRPLAARFVLTRAASERAADPAALAALVGPDTPLVVTASVAEALSVAAAAPGTPIVCVAGSLAVVGEALAHLHGTDKPCPIENGADSMDALS